MRFPCLPIPLALLLAAGPAGANGPKPPNIVVFLADDLGWADCPIHGGKDVNLVINGGERDREGEQGGLVFAMPTVERTQQSVSPVRTAICNL
jgi:hypothetical protein